MDTLAIHTQTHFYFLFPLVSFVSIIILFLDIKWKSQKLKMRDYLKLSTTNTILASIGMWLFFQLISVAFNFSAGEPFFQKLSTSEESVIFPLALLGVSLPFLTTYATDKMLKKKIILTISERISFAYAPFFILIILFLIPILFDLRERSLQSIMYDMYVILGVAALCYPTIFLANFIKKQPSSRLIKVILLFIASAIHFLLVGYIYLEVNSFFFHPDAAYEFAGLAFSFIFFGLPVIVGFAIRNLKWLLHK